MNTESIVTETVVRNHLQAFQEQKGIAAILNDYDEDARFFSETKIYQGKQEIHGFFMDFVGSLPAGAIDNFSLSSLRVDGNIAYITWSAGSGIPLGTDTFVDLLLFSWAVWQCRAQAAAGEHRHGDEGFGCVESVGAFGQCS